MIFSKRTSGDIQKVTLYSTKHTSLIVSKLENGATSNGRLDGKPFGEQEVRIVLLLELL